VPQKDSVAKRDMGREFNPRSLFKFVPLWHL
jgi:hypothetical protein